MSSQLPHPVLDPPSPASRLFGYARVSTDDQDLSLQIDALQQHGIPKTAIFMDKVSGAKTERPGLTKCLESLTSGDILVVWRLDRLWSQYATFDHARRRLAQQGDRLPFAQRRCN